ncbi:uncharacterized protein LOC131547582 [Onychostoma macrolepis]|uniref:uncharacterized protein LOC131547582 n=1 Tax=Onychostoma macrolepis TaxID=369639 RepID=UPI00272DA88E|nr:uncharacterized protein LOC131547582 [Onychostoma macrolepis]
MADNYDATFDNLVFDEDLEHILEEIFDEAQLTVCEDDNGLNGGHNDDNNLVIITAEDVQRGVAEGPELRNEPANVTTAAPSHTECSDEQLHTPTIRANARTDVIEPPTQRMYGCGQAVKRARLPEQETNDSPSASRLRTSENNEQAHDQRGLTAWSDSLVHAWDQVSFTDTESEEEEEEEVEEVAELLHEIPRELFSDRDLNRRLDREALNRVNRYFERLFDLAGQPLTYRQIEEIAANAQGDVISILRNVISCQQQHTEALRHAAEFWRNCHEELYNEFTQFRQSMIGVPEEIRENRTKQRLAVNALSLMSEHLNLLQRMLVDLHERMISRR